MVSRSGYQGEDPISQKKLTNDEGRWASTKEILGWIVDGLNFTVQMTQEKCLKVKKLIKKVSTLKYCPLQKFQKLAGNLQHAPLESLVVKVYSRQSIWQ